MSILTKTERSINGYYKPIPNTI